MGRVLNHYRHDGVHKHSKMPNILYVAQDEKVKQTFQVLGNSSHSQIGIR